MSSPLEFLNAYEWVFKFFGAFEIKSDSKLLKRLMIIYTIGYQLLFTDLGFVLFALSLLKSPSSEATLQILFVVIAYLNAVFKAMIFFTKRKQFEGLWKKLEDANYIAKDNIERG